MSLPTIGALLSHSGPPEVAGPVAGFIIDAVKCEEGHAARVLALRSRAYLGFHVGNEGAHVVPGFVDADAATAPVPVARPVLFVAATHHRRVETVERVGDEAVPKGRRRGLPVRLAASGLLGSLPVAEARRQFLRLRCAVPRLGR